MARKLNKKGRSFDYDVCLSFAGEDRKYVERTASALRKIGIRVFYDKYEEADLWGKDLYTHLQNVYQNAAKYCVMFVSKHYAKKLWTGHERQAAQARAFKENLEYILPARFDKTSIPGLLDTVGHIDIANLPPSKLAALIVKKLGDRQSVEYMPPIPDLLFEYLRKSHDWDREEIRSAAHTFFDALRKMNDEERRILFAIFRQGCPGDLPENIHINIDLLRRLVGVTPAKIKKTMGAISSLGFTSSMRIDEETEGRLGKLEMLVVRFDDLSSGGTLENATAVAYAMVQVTSENYCDQHGFEALMRLDFHQLSRSTFKAHSH